MSQNRKPEPPSSSQNPRGPNRSRGGHPRASAQSHRYEPYSNIGGDRSDHHLGTGGHRPPPYSTPQWVCRHPLGFHHDRGCEQCASQRRHITEAIQTDASLAARIAQASIDDPEALRLEIDEVQWELSTSQQHLDDCQRDLEDSRREAAQRRSEVEQARADLERERRHQSRPREHSPATRGRHPRWNGDPALNPHQGVSSALASIELLQSQLRQAEVARDNYRTHAEELTTLLLQQGHTVVAASGADVSTTLPRPYFRLEQPVQGTAPCYVVPVPDADVEMGESEQTPPTFLTRREFVLNSDGALVRHRSDPYDLPTDDEEVESDDDDFDDDDSVGRPTKSKKKAQSANKGKGKVEQTPPPPPSTSADGGSRRPPPSAPRVDRRQWPVPTPDWDRNSLPADRALWSDESNLARGSDIGPVPWTSPSSSAFTAPVVGWGNPHGHTQQHGWGAMDRAFTPAPYFSRGGGNRSIAPNRSTNRYQPPRPGVFNGIQWVARRIPRQGLAANLHGQARYEHEMTQGINAPRPPLQPGEIPPGFVSANVTTVEILRNLMDRALTSGNPGAREAVDILGDLRNVAGRAPHPRHELETIVLEEYMGKPAWAGGKAHLKPSKKGAKSAPSLLPAPAPAETDQPLSAEGSIPDPAPPIQDVHMDAVQDETVAPDVPGTEGMAPRGDKVAAPASELNEGLVGNNAPGVEGSTESSNASVSNHPHPTAQSTSGTSSIEERIRGGFNLSNPDLAREFMTLLDSAESPLQRPDPVLWDEFTTHRPGMQIFSIPMDNLLDLHRQLRRGFLVVVRRTPRPRTLYSVFLTLQALRDHWVDRPGFIPANARPTIVELTTEEVSSAEAIVHHFTMHGVLPNELDDLMIFLDRIRT
ncbi:hypothetical protein QCA50_014096 [Cerrena zonata]|uniref:Uncharacterized protein n=1 Tax=Cerrena zonata TaxID=2478898 RepID=A0AAW0FYK6_9APHY